MTSNYRHLGDIVLFFGPPCVGKGTQANIYTRFNPAVYKFSTGDKLRQIIDAKEETDLDPAALEIKRRLGLGELVDSQIVMDLTYQAFNKARMPQNRRMRYTRFILDGAPRKEDQIEPINSMGNVVGAFYFDANDDSLVSRLLNRVEEEKKKAAAEGRMPKVRSDDTPEILKERLNIYRRETLPLLDYYGNRVRKFDANKSIEEVQEEVRSAMCHALRK
jgi:adenylate kinase